ncbi:MAG: hypothetical protein U9Q62_06190 [Campylobacterota bacterium]|nr:hypothetical protein [Campylobacterota bacterium]
MKNSHDINELKAEFDKFVRDRCSIDPENPQQKNSPDQGDEIDEEPVPSFVDELTEKLLAPEHCGAYISRFDIKRIAEAVDESLPIKERKKMLKALFRHTTTRQYLRDAFDEFNRHLNGRILIYKELSEAFPASKSIFDGYTSKIKKTQKIFEQIVEDFEEIDPTAEPMPI